MLARFHQVHEQVVEVERMLAKRLMERSTPLDVGLDVEDEPLHRGLVIAVADDLERLHQRNARGEHGGELAGEDRDIARVDPAARVALTLLADARGRHALAAQLGAQSLLVGREALALDARAALVLALPGEGSVALDRPDYAGCCLSHALLPASLDGDAVDFLEAGQPVLDLLQPGAPQIPDAFLGGLGGNLHRAAHGENDAGNRLRNRQHLVETRAALVAVGTVRAPLGREDLEPAGGLRCSKALFQKSILGDVQWLLAMSAQTPRQALRNDQVHRGSY